MDDSTAESPGWPSAPIDSRFNLERSGDAITLRLPPPGWKSGDAITLMIGGLFFFGVGLTAGLGLADPPRGPVDPIDWIMCVMMLAMAGLGAYMVFCGVRLRRREVRLTVDARDVSYFEWSWWGQRQTAWSRANVIWVEAATPSRGASGQSHLLPVLLRLADGSTFEAMRARTEELQWLVEVMRLALGLRHAAPIVRVVRAGGTGGEPPPRVVRKQLGEGVRFELQPAPDPGRSFWPMLRLGLILLILPPVTVAAHALLFATLGLTTLWTANVVFGGIMSIPMLGGLPLTVMALRCRWRGPRVEVTGGRLILRPTVGFIPLPMVRPVTALRRLSVVVKRSGASGAVEGAAATADPAASLWAFCDAHPPLNLAEGYPEKHLAWLAGELAREVHLAALVQGPTPRGPQIQVDVRGAALEWAGLLDDQPEESRYELRRLASGLVIEPVAHSGGFKKQSVTFLVLGAFHGACVFSFAWVFSQNLLAVAGLFAMVLAPFVGLGLVQVAVLRRLSATASFKRITLTGEELVVEWERFLPWSPTRVERVARAAILAVERERTSLGQGTTSGGSRTLRVLLRDGKAIGVMNDSREVEQRWVLGVLARELGCRLSNRADHAALDDGRIEAEGRSTGVESLSPITPADVPTPPLSGVISVRPAQDGLEVLLRGRDGVWAAVGAVFLLVGASLMEAATGGPSNQAGRTWFSTAEFVTVFVAVGCLLIGFPLAVMSVSLPRTRWRFVGGMLLASESSGQASNESHFLRDEVAAVEVERLTKDHWVLSSTGSYVRGSRRPPLVVTLRTTDGRAATLLKGWPDEVVEWGAAVLRRWAGLGSGVGEDAAAKE